MTPNETQHIRYYRSFTDDFVESADQNHALPEGYQWIRRGIHAATSAVAYPVFSLVGLIYAKAFLKVEIIGANKIRKYEKGCFIFANHTQPQGDAFDPLALTFPKRTFIICSPANLGIPVLGRILPAAGALPLPNSLSGMKELKRAIHHHIERGHSVTIYPEAHLWPWCSWVRPFPATSFGYPVEEHAACFAWTTTYQPGKKNTRNGKPKVVIYVDGPFFPNPELPRPEAKKTLHDQIYQVMTERAKMSTVDYVEYLPEDGDARPKETR